MNRAACHRSPSTATNLSRMLHPALLLTAFACAALPLAAREKPPAAPQAIAVEATPSADTPGALYREPRPDAKTTATTYRLDPSTVRLDYREGILHITVISGLIRVELHNGHELVILSTGDDLEIGGLRLPEPDTTSPDDTTAAAPAATTPPAQPGTPAEPRSLVALFHREGDPADAANHVLRILPAHALKLRNNGGYPVAINARGKLLRLDEGGSGISLDAEGRQIVPPETIKHPRQRENPAAGGAKAGAMFKP